MKRIRDRFVKVLDATGLKTPVKAGLNRVLGAGGLPPIGEPLIFRDLDRLLATPRPRPATTTGRLLFFTMRGWTTHVALETLLGEAAAQRGMQPHFFTCGGPLPLCGITTYRAPDPTPCADCRGYVQRYFDRLGFDVHTLDSLITDDRRAAIAARIEALPDERIERLEEDGLPLGRLVTTSVRWYLLRSSAEPRELWLQTVRRFVTAAALVREAVSRLLDEVRPDRILCLNGLFFAERVLLAEATRRGIPYTTYERGFLPNSWLFRHDAIANAFPIADDFLRVAQRPLDDAASRRLDGYLRDRSRGLADAGRYWPELESDRRALARDLDLDPELPIVSAFSNITWDSATQDRDVGFDGMFDWLQETIRHFAGREDVQLVVRTHPAEVRLREEQESAERVVETLRRRLGGIPDRIRIVPSTSPLSSYTLAGMSRFVVVYTSTMGLELACAGMPVVVCGETHYRGLGFTVDVDDRSQYAERLERLLHESPPAVDVERARRYAHLFFFRFMIPLPFLVQQDGQPRIVLRRFDELGSGRDPGVDTVLDGLVAGRPILLDGPVEST